MDNLSIGPLLIRRTGLSTWLLALLAPIYKRLGIVRAAYRRMRDAAGLQPFEKPSSPGDEPQWDCLPGEPEMSFVRNSAASYRPHALLVYYAYMTPLLDALPDPARVVKILAAVDVLHQRRQSFEQAGLQGRFLNWTESTESEMLRNNDLIVAIQTEDAEALKRMAPDRPVIMAGLGTVARRRSGRAVPGRCLFVGGAGMQNLQGLKWFLDGVWPRVRSSLPGSSLHVCGGICDLIAESHPGVSFQGRLKSLEAEYQAAEVCVIPLLAGSGLKIKLVEALAHGLACVTTPVGAQGIPGLSNCAVVTSEPDEFADAVLDFLMNASRRMEYEAKAHQFAASWFSPEAAFGPLVDFIRQKAQVP
jgi:hypothetical protein